MKLGVGKARAAMYFLLLQVKMLFGCDIPDRARKNLCVSYVRHFGMSHIIHTGTFASFPSQILRKRMLSYIFSYVIAFGSLFYIFPDAPRTFCPVLRLACVCFSNRAYYRYRLWYMLLWVAVDGFNRLLVLFLRCEGSKSRVCSFLSSLVCYNMNIFIEFKNRI